MKSVSLILEHLCKQYKNVTPSGLRSQESSAVTFHTGMFTRQPCNLGAICVFSLSGGMERNYSSGMCARAFMRRNFPRELWGKLIINMVLDFAHIHEHMQKAKYYVCEYESQGNIIGAFAYVPTNSVLNILCSLTVSRQNVQA